MKVRDEDQWQGQLAELAADPDPMAARFTEFLVGWAGDAEDFLEHAEHGGEFIAAVRDPVSDAVEALRELLPAAQEAHGWMSIGFVGQALVVLSQHWAPTVDPTQFYEALTSIEQNLYQDVIAMKMAILQEQAAEESVTIEEFLAAGEREQS